MARTVARRQKQAPPAGGFDRDGQGVHIQVAGERLRIPENVTFNIEHERSGADDELEFQVLWSRQD